MKMPEFVSLRMLYRSHENWEIVLFLLKDAALRLFGCQFLEQAFIWVGGGKNGKGAWWSALEYVMGSYAKGILKELLTSASMPAETAAPLKMSLRGRRYLMIPELDHKTKVQSTTFKEFRDPASTISARTLYGDIVPFKVSWGMVLCTNTKVSFTTDVAEDGGVERSVAVIRWPFRFRPSHLDSPSQIFLPSLIFCLLSFF